ncbi:MAG TPA: transglycosylase SLT domain-containing protein, partial [Pyrinomonadaceae bacterium]|nr:transglycosylase SLT domain-containing protein [Pyrinomonadaceae bacterium]
IFPAKRADMKKSILLIAIIFAFSILTFAQSDSSLRLVTEKDLSSRDANGKLLTLTVAEHLYRADVYMANRHFAEAREHWQKILDNYPSDTNAMPKALFGMGRSLMWERQYKQAVDWFDKLLKDYAMTKDGREGLAFKGACLVRLGKNTEAAKTYEQYTIMFPTGEKIESAYLNIIDAWREAGKYAEANLWVDKTRARFSGMAVETNAMHSRLRMEIYRQNWTEAVKAADDLLLRKNFANAMVTSDEVKYLKGFALEKLGRKPESIAAYSSINDNIASYYGGLATEKLRQLNAGNQVQNTASISAKMMKDYPVLYRAELLRSAKSLKIDPRFVLAIMKQESSFRANAKSPSAARGLLQLVFDTATKYNKKAGYVSLNPDDLYLPSVNIAIGSVYIAELKDQFNGLYEAIAASYNGGEDNAARWLNRSKPKDAGIFTSEVGFAETKNYVYKVMSNYRVYRELYTEDLNRK